MPLPDSIRDRIELFARNEEQYRDPSYKEAQLRQEFLDPFFAALGWDMENKAGHAEPYKDVIHEDAIKIGGETKAPDYSFRIGGNRKFFVEAKKPAVLIKDDPAPAYQLRRYSWSAKLPLGILTDFQEFAIYDTRIRPAVGDKAQVARIFYCTFRDYPEKWDELAGIFSKEAILRGSFDKYAASTRGKRGTATVDDSFLEEIERWRDLLARHLALRNESLTQRDLNFVVQRLIDRLIFLRIAEDRGLEPFGQLQALTAGNHLYPRLCEIFERADYRYNSGLFHFEKDTDCTESPDRLSLRLQLDDAPLKDVIKNLYYPASPYVFSVIPADILGSVYERFLGKVIHLTEGHRARIEEKPEVRKAGGVYYTPTYIVDYIVRQTVGTLVAGKSPKQIEKLRVLDPACGSGSFLLGAYQFLLDWYLDYYVRNDPAKWAKQKPARLYEPAPNAHGIGKGSGNWQLTTAERRRILLAHIHGVDIDAQAVEVTKLSLLLKVLEGEARETQGRTREMSAVLPDLGKNIRCGNSLVGHDFYAQPDLPELDDEARLQLNTFDWAEGFPEIMRAGGFDAVIGNPPYVLLQDQLRDDAQLQYFRSRFSVTSFKVDTYHLFIEQSVRKLRANGRIGLITPANFLTNNHLKELRRFLVTECRIEAIGVLEGSVFDGASVDTAIITLSRPADTISAFQIRTLRANESLELVAQQNVSPSAILADKNFLFTGSSSVAASGVWKKCVSVSQALGTLATVSFGKQLRDRKKFVDDVIHVSALGRVPRTHRPCYTGKDINRYSVRWDGLACLDDELARSGGCWDSEKHTARGKLLTRQIGKRPEFGIDALGYDCLNTMFMVVPISQGGSNRYLLGILNSRLLRFLWEERFWDKRGTFPKIKGTYLKELPIMMPPDRERHDRLVELVDRMLALHAKLGAAQSPDVEDNLRRQIAATDQAIDALVYQLYGLTPEEIALVESATAPQADATKEQSSAEVSKTVAYDDQATAAAAHFHVEEEPPAKE